MRLSAGASDEMMMLPYLGVPYGPQSPPLLLLHALHVSLVDGVDVLLPQSQQISRNLAVKPL